MPETPAKSGYAACQSKVDAIDDCTHLSVSGMTITTGTLPLHYVAP